MTPKCYVWYSGSVALRFRASRLTLNDISTHLYTAKESVSDANVSCALASYSIHTTYCVRCVIVYVYLCLFDCCVNVRVLYMLNANECVLESIRANLYTHIMQWDKEHTFSSSIVCVCSTHGHTYTRTTAAHTHTFILRDEIWIVCMYA